MSRFRTRRACRTMAGASFTWLMVTRLVILAAADFPSARTYTNGVRIVFVRIEPGTFRMGTVPEDKHGLIGFRVAIAALPSGKPSDGASVLPLNS